MVSNMPFSVGQVFWMAVQQPRKVTIPCTVCFGKLAVAVILGNDEHVSVPCESCGKGYDGPRGTITEWEYEPHAEKFVVAGVHSFYDDRWTLKSTDGSTCDLHALHDTEEAALEASAELAKQQYERNMQSRQHKRKNVKEATWSIRYHRERIKEAEQQIAWHQSRIGANR